MFIEGDIVHITSNSSDLYKFIEYYTDDSRYCIIESANVTFAKGYSQTRFSVQVKDLIPTKEILTRLRKDKLKRILDEV